MTDFGTPDTVDGLADELLAHFNHEYPRGVDEFAGDHSPEGLRRHIDHVMSMVSTHIAYRLLTALRDAAPDVCAEVVKELWSVHDSGDVAGEQMWQWAHERGLTPCDTCHYPAAWPVNDKVPGTCPDHRVPDQVTAREVAK